MDQRRKTITIFEGSDGSGKSTAAKRFAALTGACYIHSSAWPHVIEGLPRMYMEAMLPALLGYQDVVMDRSWLSEQPYGAVYRNGSDRVGAIYRRMLERVAMSCGALVVRCDPGPEVCVANWAARRHSENKSWENDVGVRNVNEGYRRNLRTELLVVDYDYSTQPEFHTPELLDNFRPERHFVQEHSAGNWHGTIALVGESFGEPKNHDCLYQYPFVSFARAGCSSWVTEQLEVAGLAESHFMWANADMVYPGGHNVDSVEHIIALGQAAHEQLEKMGYTHHTVGHPQHAKRFNHGQPYELVDLVKELLA
jgi:thymidylate kinase